MFEKQIKKPNKAFNPSVAGLDQWLEYIEAIHPRNIELGLDRAKQVAARLGVLYPCASVVTIAGTNGKGSTGKALQALLRDFDFVDQPEVNGKASSNRLRVGAFSSPHFLRFNERIQIDGIPVEDSEICEVFKTVESARLETELTYFEFTTLAALSIFEKKNVDVMILEVGLGGRLDTVNIIDADIAVITNIALDHQDWLGETRDAIAIEKMGILRDKQVLILGEEDLPSSMIDRIQGQASEEFFPVYYQSKLNSSRNEVNDAASNDIVHGWEYDQSNNLVAWLGTGFEHGPLLSTAQMQVEDDISCVEFGLHPSAWSCALYAAYSLEKIHNQKIVAVQSRRELQAASSSVKFTELLRHTQLLGRMSEHEYRDRILILDVAHNPAAIERFIDVRFINKQLVSSIKKTQQSVKNGQVAAPSHIDSVTEDILIFAAMADKDIESIFSKLLGHFSRVVLTDLPDNSRAADAQEMRSIAEKLGYSSQIKFCSASVEAAINWSMQNSEPRDKIYVVGSFFTVAAALAMIQ